MLFPNPQTMFNHLCNVFGALLVGLFFAFVGLNAASGCGQGGGQCIGVRDFIQAPTVEQLATLPQRAG